jgi:hypothetical protein
MARITDTRTTAAAAATARSWSPATATSRINDLGDVAGFATNAAGTTEGFLELPNGTVVHLNVLGASATQALGVNNGDEVVGDYAVGSGSNQTTDGFIWASGLGFATVTDPEKSRGDDHQRRQ